MPRTIGVLVFPNFQLLDAAGPITAFELANREIDPSAYRLRLLATAAGQVMSSSGIMLVVEDVVGAPVFDTLIVAGGLGARERVAEPLPVERLADRAAMSARHFARAFTSETGVTPAKAIEHLRLEAARAQVEDGCDPIDRVAEMTGFRDPERMRRAFVRAFGQPPQALRRAARINSAPASL